MLLGLVSGVFTGWGPVYERRYERTVHGQPQDSEVELRDLPTGPQELLECGLLTVLWAISQTFSCAHTTVCE